MNKPMLLDLAALESDLRMATAYAARVGVLGDPALLESLEAVERSRRPDDAPDGHSLTLALNRTAQAIAPMTLADLRCGRDPFEPKNQRSARVLQLLLAILAVATMLFIGDSMQSLRIEKTGMKALEQFQAQVMQPSKKVTELRKMAQFDDPLAKPNLSSDLYREKLAEWVALYQTRVLLDSRMAAAVETNDWPWSGPPPDWLAHGFENLRQALGAVAATARAGETDESAISAAGPDATAQVRSVPTPAPSAKPAGGTSDDFCVRDEHGAFKLPAAASRNPDWVRNLTADSINDFCFQYQVLQPITGDQSMNLSYQNLGRVEFLPRLETKIEVRSQWWLPFLFGWLGAIIFVMRNIASIRTPAMELFPMFMRISLGGVAGIVVGWFSTSALPAFQSTSALSVPFALAFLTGYGIDALFGVLDRMSRVAATAPSAALTTA